MSRKEEKNLTTESTEGTEKGDGEKSTFPVGPDGVVDMRGTALGTQIDEVLEKGKCPVRTAAADEDLELKAERRRHWRIQGGVAQYEQYYQAALAGVVGFFGLAPNVPPAVLDERAHTMALAALASRGVRHDEVRAMLERSGEEEI